MKFAALASGLAAVLAFSVHAHALEFSLNCADMLTEKPLPMKVVKAPRKGATGKWENFYFIETIVSGKMIRVPLAPRGSGDEGYDEYRTPDEAHRIGLQGASISHRFKWASVVNTEGSSFADCR